ncbi:hybrid sensor histidine kinase/response regulator [Janthinobacterium fluminis]|uniref:histidine kinase n=1 Tax=Janthinobacterium fluminis TaxID=2987524 RepID=A0ABT5K7K7_9BURK|nr:ATP-binding protein [Janthinobacterium fluminis]MDC8760420.1 ATP-binding protein [Janthinobacterium fluminis]
MAADGSAVRVLVVDDEASHMQALCDTLRDYGYQTVGFTAGEAALAELGGGGYALLLADLMMPGMDGITLLQAALRSDPDLACLIMTGDGTIGSAVEAMQQGALDYILKPFKLSVILPVLKRALAMRQLRIDKAQVEQSLRERAAELAQANRELDLARAKAELASRAKSAFISSMSHELRTPLNAILGFSHILSSTTLPSTAAQKREFAAHILKSSKHLLALINEILDLAKVESGTMELELQAVPLAELIQECATLIQPLCAARQLRLALPAAAQLRALADPTRLKQIMLNLLSNAAKYNREGGAIAVHCGAGGGRVRIRVCDTGMGLRPEQLGELFQPFNRLGQEHGGEEGTGIGLVVTRRLVELMDGAIGAASEPGQGSEFWIDLPAA